MRRRTSRLIIRAPRPSSVAVSRSMRSNRSSGTAPELILAKLLRRKLIRSVLPGRPDFVYPKSKLAVFVQGCWWHSCQICNIPLPKTHRRYWTVKLERNVERDEKNMSELGSLGWRVLEIWEHEVYRNPKAAASKIKQLAGNHLVQN